MVIPEMRKDHCSEMKLPWHLLSLTITHISLDMEHAGDRRGQKEERNEVNWKKRRN